jgi:hypothetical protein
MDDVDNPVTPWLPHIVRKTCAGCDKPFGCCRKKMNCYCCGDIYCNECCSRERSLLSWEKRCLICDACHFTFESYADVQVKESFVVNVITQAKYKIPDDDVPPPRCNFESLYEELSGFRIPDNMELIQCSASGVECAYQHPQRRFHKFTVVFHFPLGYPDRTLKVTISSKTLPWPITSQMQSIGHDNVSSFTAHLSL